MSPDTPDVTPQDASADANAPEGTTPAVKKPRAPRKTAVKTEAAAEHVEAPVAEAEAAAPVPRKRTRKVAEPVEAGASEAAPAPAVQAVEAAAPEVLEVREPRAPRVRAERRPAAVAEDSVPQAAEAAERGEAAGSDEGAEEPARVTLCHDGKYTRIKIYIVPGKREGKIARHSPAER